MISRQDNCYGLCLINGFIPQPVVFQKANIATHRIATDYLNKATVMITFIKFQSF